MLSKKKQVKPEKAKKRDPRKAFSRIDLAAESQHVPGKPEKRSLILRRSGSAGVAKDSKDIQQILDCVERIMSTVDEPMVLLDSNLKVISASRRFYSTFKLTTKKTEKESFWKLGDRQWDIPLLKEQLDELLHKKTSLENLKLKQKLSHLKESTMLVNARIIYSQMKKPELILLAIKDITERKRAEEAVVKSEQKYRFLYEESLSFNIIIGSDQLIKDANKTALNLLGYRKDEVIGKPALKFIRDEDKERVKGILSDALMGKITQENEIPVLAKDGSVHTILFSPGQLILREGGSRKGIVVTGVDITERKRAEEQHLNLLNSIQQEKDKLSTFVNSIADEVWFFNAQGNVTLMNPAAVSEFGIATENSISLSDLMARLEVYNADGTPRTQEENPALRSLKGETLKKVEEIVRNPLNGEIRYRQVSSSPVTTPDGQIIGAVCVVRDISEQKQAEEALRETKEHLEIRVRERTGELEQMNRTLQEQITERKRAEEAVKAERQRFNDVLETLPAYLVLLTPDYHVPFANRFFRERFGESHGKRCFEYLFNRTEPCEICETYTVLKTMAPHRWEWTGPDGRNYDIYDFPFTDTDGSTLILEMGIDITDRKLVEEELRRHKEHLEEIIKERTRELESRNAQLAAEIAERKQAEEALIRAKKEWERTFDSVPDLIAILDNQYQIVRVNKAMAQRLGTIADKCIGLNCFKCVHGTTKPPELCPYVLTLRDGQEHVAEIHEDHLGGDFLVSTTPLFDEEDQMIGSVHVARDITERMRAEQALRESEERLKKAQEIAHLGSWELDLLNNRLSWSDEAYRIFGLKPQEFGASYEAFLEAVHPDDRKAVDAAYSGSLHEGKDSYEIEHRIVRKESGEVRIVREKCEHIRDKSGRIVRSVGMVQDITEQKLAERKIKDLARFPLENPNPVLRINKAGNILHANPASRTLLEDWGTTIGGFVPAYWRQLVAEVINSGIDKTVETEHRGKILSLNLVSFSGADDVNVYGRDVTELKKVTAELAASNKELEAFSYSVSHDLRAPLRNINGFSQALLEDYSSKLDEKGKDYLNRVRAATQRMAGLIDGLLQLSLTMRKEMQREKVNLSKLAHTVIEELKETEPGREVEVIIQEGMFVHGDVSLLRDMLENLLGNAWKFTAARSRARIEFNSTEKEGEKIFFISDNGAGFDAKYVDKLFIPFQRLHSAGEFSGHGIGLALVKRIIDRHGGNIWVEGEVDKGATFYFKL